MPTATIDYGTKIHDLSPDQVSLTISTYGNHVGKSSAQQQALAALKPGAVRIPLQWNGGNVVSSAGGGPHDSGLGDLLIDKIIAMGAAPHIVIGGSADNNFSPSEAALMARHYLGKVKHYIVGNEPGNGGMSLSTYADLFNKTSAAIKAIDSSLTVAGPAWAYFDRNNLTTFMDSCKGHFDIVDYHHYAMGNPPAPSTDATLNATKDWHDEVSFIRSELDKRNLQNVRIQVGEYNWAWQYNDGRNDGDGGDHRFYQPCITAWAASLIGQVLTAGGLSFAYSDQNGPLGITVEPGNKDQGRPGNTPQPIYWGIGAWTGAAGHPPLGKALYKVTTDSTSVEVYATDTKIVAINKTNVDQQITLKVTGAAVGNGHVSSASDGYASPTAVSAVQTPTTLHPYQVLTLAVTRSGVTPTPVPTPTPTPVPTPTPTPTPVPAGQIIGAGQVIGAGSDATWARLVQRLLVKAGYTTQQVNGGYGTTTTANVRDFQSKHGLQVTGMVDEATLDKLIG